MKNYFSKVSKVSLVLVFLVIMAGSLVRMTGSGMGCPDWPKCFGYLIPPIDISQVEWASKKEFSKGVIIRYDKKLIVAKKSFTSGNKINLSNWENYTKHDYSDFDVYKTWIEFLNRLLGVIAGLATLLMLVLSLNYWKEKKLITISSLLIVLGMGFQAWLGKLVVDSNLAPFKITVHMLMALLIICLISYSIFLSKTKSNTNYFSNKTIKSLVIFSALISLIQIVFGTQVREFVDLQYEAIGPENKNEWLNAPNFYFYFHRSFSVLIFSINFALFLIVKLKNYYSWFIDKIIFVVFLEILVGLIMYYGDFPIFSQPIHLVLATILFSLQFYWILILNRSSNGI